MLDKENIYRQIGKKIKHYRKLKGLTQRELAEKLNISNSYITKIEAENCNKTFSLDILIDIADVLQVELKDFFNF